jgi:membrane protease YdiL (CAAX protease family)
MLSGIAEECFFRGILLQEIGPLWSSLIFGLLHTGHRNLASLGAWSALVGMLLCLLYVHTGNLAAPIAMHCLNNLLAFIFLKYSD